jgi:hypothetical protein
MMILTKEQIKELLKKYSNKAVHDLAAQHCHLLEELANLKTAYGMFLNGLAYYSTCPDSQQDAEYLQKQATYWFLYARNFIPAETHSDCSEMAKKESLK